jgi:hypothetical protein
MCGYMKAIMQSEHAIVLVRPQEEPQVLKTWYM